VLRGQVYFDSIRANFLERTVRPTALREMTCYDRRENSIRRKRAAFGSTKLGFRTLRF
jgi:hypothetical protein